MLEKNRGELPSAIFHSTRITGHRRGYGGEHQFERLISDER